MSETGKKRGREYIEDPFNEPITESNIESSLKKPKTNAPARIKEAASKTFQILSQKKINAFIESREPDKDIDTVISEYFTQGTSDASNVSEDFESAASSSAASEASEASEVKTVFTEITRLSKMSWDSTMDVSGNKDPQLKTVMDSFQRTKQEFGEDDDYKNTLDDELLSILKEYMPENDENDVMMTRLTDRSMTTIKKHYKKVFGEYGIIFNKYKKDHSALHEAFFQRLYSGNLSGTGIDKIVLKTSLVKDLHKWASCVTFLSWRLNIPFFYKYDLKSDTQSSEKPSFEIIRNVKRKFDEITDETEEGNLVGTDVDASNFQRDIISGVTEGVRSASNSQPNSQYESHESGEESDDESDDSQNTQFPMDKPGGKKSKAKKGLKKNHKTNKKRSNRSFMVKGKKTKPRKTQRKKNKKKKTQRKKFVVKKDIKKKTKRVRFNL
jgi:hypothetical protein